MEMMKVFMDFPKNIHKLILNSTEQISNDCFIWWEVMYEYPDRSWYDSDEEFYKDVAKDNQRIINHTENFEVDLWLMEQGCRPGEAVILEHMW